MRPLPVADQLRAGLVLLHLVAVLAMAAPAPVGLNAAKMRSANLRDTVAGWGAAARSLGLPLTDEALSAGILEGGTRIMALRRVALAPFRPYARWCGVEQGWSMFGMVNRHPARLEVHLRRGEGPWEPLYIARDPVARWQAERFDQERFRGALNAFSWGESKPLYGQMADWIARQAALEHPGAELRVSMARLRLLDPADYAESRQLPVEARRWERRYRLTGPIVVGAP
jgi:hypothetical protein